MGSAATRRQAGDARALAARAGGADAQARARQAAAPRSDAAGSELRLPAAQASTTRATRRRWSSASAARRASSSCASRKRCATTPAATARARSCYSVGWTHHTVGVQYIRAAAIVQLLLGNIGRPGGGILALRGHASIQGSTDIPTLYDLLPGYIPMPQPNTSTSRRSSTRTARRPASGRTWTPTRSACSRRGTASTRARGERLLLRLPAANHRRPFDLSHDHGDVDGTVKGFFCVGENPAVGSANASLHRRAMANLEWLVVRDFFEIESRSVLVRFARDRDGRAAHRRDRDRDLLAAGGGSSAERAARSPTRSGCCSGITRPSNRDGDCRSELWFYYHLGHRIRAKLRDSHEARDRAILELTLGLPDGRDHRGTRRARGAARDQRLGADGKALPAYTKLKADGSTACGCWIYCGVFKDEQNQAARRKPGARADVGRIRVGMGMAGEPAPALQPCLGGSRRQAVERTQEVRLVGRDRKEMDRRGRAGLPARQGSRLRPARGRAGGERARRPVAVHHAGRRQRVALRA